MELIVDGNTVSHQPTDLDVTRVLSELSTGQHDFVVLNNSAHNITAQVARGTDGALVLEVIDSNLGSTMRSAEHFIDGGTVTNVFLSVLEGTHRWSTETQWVTSSGTAPTASSTRSAMLAIVIAISLAIMGLAIFLAQASS